MWDACVAGAAKAQNYSVWPLLDILSVEVFLSLIKVILQCYVKAKRIVLAVHHFAVSLFLVIGFFDAKTYWFNSLR